MKSFLTAAFTMMTATAQAQSLGAEFFAFCTSPQSMSHQAQAIYTIAECEQKPACSEYEVIDFRSGIVTRCLTDAINICARDPAAEGCIQAVTKMMRDYTQEIAAQFPGSRINSALDGGGFLARSLERANDRRSSPLEVECGDPAELSRYTAYGISEATICAILSAGTKHMEIESIARRTVLLERRVEE